MNSSRVYTTQRAKDFLTSAEGIAAHADLEAMEKDKGYKTVSTYSPASENGVLLFIDRHMNYLSSHASVNASQYISNLRLVTKIRF
ncbi:MAG: hypothetical protein JWN28_505 [Candidatus Saccharibacteria bacterium]|nr:hypothetical protein [Candidatus Saccharibacteria bacterium]